MQLNALNKKIGVTLFELLVVILVTSILTVIFILSSRHVFITSKISRVKEEHKVLNGAINHYQMDFSSVPSNYAGLRALRSSIRYIESVPHDPFSPNLSQEYYYIANPSDKYRYFLISAGPDGDVDLLPLIQEFQRRNNGTVTAPSSSNIDLRDSNLDQFIKNMTYDPTNGLNSNGDIITIDPVY